MLEVARAYLVLGVEHILGGIDHLLFVLALMLLIRDPWMLVKTITAFTLAHSITLTPEGRYPMDDAMTTPRNGDEERKPVFVVRAPDPNTRAHD